MTFSSTEWYHDLTTGSGTSLPRDGPICKSKESKTSNSMEWRLQLDPLRAQLAQLNEVLFLVTRNQLLVGRRLSLDKWIGIRGSIIPSRRLYPREKSFSLRCSRKWQLKNWEPVRYRTWRENSLRVWGAMLVCCWTRATSKTLSEWIQELKSLTSMNLGRFLTIKLWRIKSWREA